MSAQQIEEYGKLVRDQIPAIIQAAGSRPVVRTLEPGEFLPAALAKVVEEATELRDASEQDRLDELADLWEIQSAVVTACGLSWDQVLERATQRSQQRGRFEDRVWLVAVERS